ncbi:MAG TPA: molybdenum cofactor guanylyltransferase [Steroidobacteraceae bacterium]|nr:molybdenum cofactor guanylyltransferase [Steroidobacteraceae bacterium]
MVIAGGRSVRFGGEKAVAILSGVPLLLWATRRLQRTCGVVAVNARRGTQAEGLARAEGLPVLHDEEGDPLGPLAGVKVALKWARDIKARALAVSPCDVPLLPDDVFARLIEAAGAGAAMAETPEGPQPLCSVWPVSALPSVTEALIGGRHPATWLLLTKLGARGVRFSSPAAFANINTPGDLATLSSRLYAEAAQRAR